MDFPEVFDSTILASFRSCPRKARLEYFEHWKPRALSVHLHAGAAFARGLEVARRSFYEEGAIADDAVAAGMGALVAAYGDFECPADSAKSLERMMGALEFYFHCYPFGIDSASPIDHGGRRGIEFSFAEPLPVLHPTTGDPIIYAGRADMIADYAGGIYVVDEKTTSSLGASWTRQWDLRSQFTGYCWAARRSGIPVNGVLVRGISILKTKYDTAEVLTYRAEWEIDRWLAQVTRDITRAVAAWREDYFDYNLDHACTEYGGCPFVQICRSPEPGPWLDTYFERRIWDPLAREERLCPTT